MKKEVEKELLRAVCLALGLFGIDVEASYPNLYKESKGETK